MSTLSTSYTTAKNHSFARAFCCDRLGLSSGRPGSSPCHLCIVAGQLFIGIQLERSRGFQQRGHVEVEKLETNCSCPTFKLEFCFFAHGRFSLLYWYWLDPQVGCSYFRTHEASGTASFEYLVDLKSSGSFFVQLSLLSLAKINVRIAKKNAVPEKAGTLDLTGFDGRKYHSMCKYEHKICF